MSPPSNDIVAKAAADASPQESLRGGDDPLSSSILSNLQLQLGLKLDAIKARIEMIVIDRVEKTPTPD
jgi:uncharacterized protein (TIGR03435 family)